MGGIEVGGMCTTIGLFGSTGKMGQIIQRLAVEDFANQSAESAVKVVPFLRPDGHPPLPTTVNALMDFSVAEAALDHIDIAVKNCIPFLIGTTGLCPQTEKSIHQAGRCIPVLKAPNTSLGSTVLEILAAKAATLLGADFDIEICETHHRYKKDAPSGTALSLGRSVSAARGIPFSTSFTCESKDIRTTEKKQRSKNEIGYAVMRGGGVVGDHSVHFLGEDESVTLSHRGFSRVLFARGALKAVLWLKNQPPGVYTMTDFLIHSLSLPSYGLINVKKQ